MGNIGKVRDVPVCLHPGECILKSIRQIGQDVHVPGGLIPKKIDIFLRKREHLFVYGVNSLFNFIADVLRIFLLRGIDIRPFFIRAFQTRP